MQLFLLKNLIKEHFFLFRQQVKPYILFLREPISLVPWCPSNRVTSPANSAEGAGRAVVCAPRARGYGRVGSRHFESSKHQLGALFFALWVRLFRVRCYLLSFHRGPARYCIPDIITPKSYAFNFWGLLQMRAFLFHSIFH